VKASSCDVVADQSSWVDADDPEAELVAGEIVESDLLGDAADLDEADTCGSGVGIGHVVNGERNVRIAADVAELGRMLHRIAGDIDRPALRVIAEADGLGLRRAAGGDRGQPSMLLLDKVLRMLGVEDRIGHEQLLSVNLIRVYPRNQVY
jgi:hypothetical protein